MGILITIGIVIATVLLAYWLTIGLPAFEEKRLERKHTREKKQRWFDVAEKFVKSIPLMNSSSLILLDKVADKMIELTDTNKFTLKPYDYYMESRFGGNIVIDSKGTPRLANFSNVNEMMNDMPNLDDVDCLYMQLLDGYELKNIVNEYLPITKEKELDNKKHMEEVKAVEKFINTY